MFTRTNVLALLGFAVLLTACDSGDKSLATAKQDDPLPATESQKDFGDYVIYFNTINTDQLTPDIIA